MVSEKDESYKKASHAMVVVKEETLGGNAFLAIESTPGDEEEEGAVRKGMIALVPHPFNLKQKE
jgi:hypothetical protein